MENKWVHPEIKEGEIFIINVRDSEKFFSTPPEFCEYVRRGNVAYATGGKEIVNDMKPLFGKLKKLKK